jgi:oxalate decarboxylase/phosphoglucose isomerase-like protein (cupin superfamily)
VYLFFFQCYQKGFGEVATTLSSVEWFVDFYHQLREQEVPVLECIQRPGDIIFVPHGWFHIVLNLENSVAVTHNYVSESNLQHVMHFLDNTPDQVSGVSATEQHNLGRRLRLALQEKRPHILEHLQEAEARARKLSPWDEVKTGETFSLLKQ